MKKRTIAVFFLLLMLVAAGCSFSQGEAPMAVEEKTAEISIREPQPSVMPDPQTEDEVAAELPDVEMSPEDIAARERLGLTADSIASMKQAQAGLFHFDQLDAAEQTLYVELLKVMEEYGAGIVLSSLEEQVIEKCFSCVLNDHPELFYVVGYRFTKYSLEETIKKITFSATYNASISERDEKQGKIDTYVNSCLAGLPENANEYVKVKYVYEYLINNTEYDAQVEDDQNICSVFLSNRSVCQGYAKATQYLLQRMGVQATLVMGHVSGGEGHAWNLVTVNGKYYHVDTTWGDASYQVVGGNTTHGLESIPPINYDYLCVTTEQLQKTHSIEAVIPLPDCTAMDDNYYVREGLYFTEVDEARLQEVFIREYEKQSNYITLKSASAEVHREMMDFLINRQKVFKYLKSNDGVVKYADNDEQLSLSFWL